MFLDWFWSFAHFVGYHGKDIHSVMCFCTGGKVSLIWIFSTLAIYLAFRLLKWIFLSPLGQLFGELLLGTLMHTLVIVTAILVIFDWLLLAICCLALHGPICLLWFIGFDLCWNWCWYKVYEAIH